MNILYIDHYAGSINHGRSFRPYYLGQEWQKTGNHLVVVAGTYSHLRNEQPKKSGVEIIDGITYLWLKTPKYHGNGAKRALSMMIFMIQLFLNIPLILRLSKPDIIIGSTVYMLDMYPAWLMKAFAGSNTKLVFELHDLWPMSLTQLGNMSPYHPFVILIKMTELWTYKVIDKVISILPYTLEYIKGFGLKKKNFAHIPNGIVLKDWDNPAPLPKQHQDLINQLKKDGKFIVSYTGSHSLANALEDLIDACSILESQNISNIHVILIGDGNDKPHLVKYAKSLGIQNITFLEKIPKLSILTFLQQMDLLYIGLQNKPLFKYGVSANKIFDYMMAGRPILQAISDGSDLVNEAQCGISINAGDPNKIADSILKLSKMPAQELEKMGYNGKQYVIANHDYKTLAKRFLDELKSIK